MEKYLIAEPADVDGDCIDDLTELDSLGSMSPVNPAVAIDLNDGAVAVPDEAGIQGGSPGLGATSSSLCLASKALARASTLVTSTRTELTAPSWMPQASIRTWPTTVSAVRSPIAPNSRLLMAVKGSIPIGFTAPNLSPFAGPPLHTGGRQHAVA